MSTVAANLVTNAYLPPSYIPHYCNSVTQRNIRKMGAFSAVVINEFLAPRFTTNEYELAKEMVMRLGAVRGICKYEDCDTYSADMSTLADAKLEDSTIREYLLLSGFNASEISDWFSEAANNDYICTEDGYFMSADAALYCPREEAYYSDNADFTWVTVSPSAGRQRWGEYALERWAFYCDISNKWYDRDYYDQCTTDGGDTICGDIAGELGYEYDDDEDAYVKIGNSNRIPGYHDGYRGWHETLVVADRSTRAFYGIEIEVDFHDATVNRGEFYRDHLNDFEANKHYCCERDGSLCESYGMEIVTRPFPLQELQTPNNKLAELYAKLNAVGVTNFSENDEDYGIHITANWGRLDEPHQERLRAMVYKQRRMTNLIAGRECEEYANITTLLARHQAFDTKYTAVRIRSDLAAEFRVFKSTLDYSRLLSYVEYVDALTEWTRDPEHAIDGAMAASAFRAWVRENPRYSNLAQRFTSKTPTKSTALETA